jgi:hypothetical protein
MHFKTYTEEQFVNIAVEILDKGEGLERDLATLIAEAVFNILECTNVRECVRNS